MDPRAELYKRRLGDAPYEICIERARLVTGAYRRTEGQPPATRAAKAFEQIVRHVTCSVLPEERIAGNRTSKVLGTVLPVERGDVNVILELELDALLARPERPFHIEPEDRRELVREILPWWRGRTLRERKNALLRRAGLVTLPALGPRALIERRRALDLGRLGRVVTPPGARPIAALRGLWGVLHNNPGLATNVFDVQGHLILGHCNVLRKGFRGIREEAGRRLAEGRATLDSEGRAFLDAVIRSTEAMRELGHRMAEACVRAASAAPEPGRRRELLDMAARCRHLPWEPPESFVEAVQALWLTQEGGLLAYGSPAILAAGRLDQHLVPYYLEDLRAGRITEGEASGL
ncbi:MAG: pyruvate formate lyase family protein, partial [Polyangia bacterium]|nr:pyruvate formate lyase family protein [Polyangia bacterium]